MAEIGEGVKWLLGLDTKNLTIYLMASRAAIVDLAALAIVRVEEKQFLSKNTAFDFILGIRFGSMVSRAITSSSSVFATLIAAIAYASRSVEITRHRSEFGSQYTFLCVPTT
jgi:uncharacterized membrane protein YcaP (DUF421 family)